MIVIIELSLHSGHIIESHFFIYGPIIVCVWLLFTKIFILFSLSGCILFTINCSFNINPLYKKLKLVWSTFTFKQNLWTIDETNSFSLNGIGISNEL